MTAGVVGCLAHKVVTPDNFITDYTIDYTTDYTIDYTIDYKIDYNTIYRDKP